MDSTSIMEILTIVGLIAVPCLGIFITGGIVALVIVLIKKKRE